MNSSIFSTLSGKLSIKHPVVGILVREDGYVLNRKRGGRGRGKGIAWTTGCTNNYGYQAVRVRGKTYKVHRLVAELFIPNPQGKRTIDHINRIRSDNRVCNLRWATQKEQIANSSRIINAKNKNK